jgi:8-amino-7-oxononanoate synthase
MRRRFATLRQIALTFATPTAFRQGQYDTALPTRDSVFNSLLNRWNKYSGIELSNFSIEAIFPSFFNIRTEIAADSRSKFIGCVGEISYRLMGDVEPLQIKQINALADFALYAGIGRKTPMGMGMVRRRLIQAAIAATKEFGTGSTGSRLLSGHRELHRELECAIASLKQTEDALVFSSGYLANLGTLAALVGKRDLILSDQYNHSSLKNGAILSGAVVVDYAHSDIEDLKSQLAQHRQHYRRCLIVTDSVFSMDGDLCPLPEILAIAEEFSCMVLVDEAHATGVLGATGAGCVEHFGCTGQTLIQVGTLSKALGSLGGYVAGSAALIDFLRNRAPSWIYTTALSPADTAAALEAVQIVQQEPERRAQLNWNVDTLKQLMQEHCLISNFCLLSHPSSAFN